MSIIKYSLGGNYDEAIGAEALLPTGPVDLLGQGLVQIVIKNGGFALMNDSTESPLVTNGPITDALPLSSLNDGLYVDFSDISGALDLNGGEQGDIFLAGSGNDNMKGGGGNDVLLGGAGDDTLKGGGGSDILEGGLGSNNIQGGGGNDTVSYEHFDSPVDLGFGHLFGVRVDLDLGTGSVNAGTLLVDTLTDISSIRGSTYDDELSGNAGGNVIEGGAGADTIDGRDGIDTLSYSHSTQGVTVELFSRSASGGDAEGDVIDGMENVIGSTAADDLTGDDGANTLTGNGGIDTLNGLGGNDRLVISSTPADVDGGADRDLLFVTGGGFVSLTEASFAGIEVVYVRNDTHLDMSAVHVGSRIVSQSTFDHAVDITGTSRSDLVQGATGGDRLFAGAGADTFHFQAGFGRDNVYGFDAANDHIAIAIEGVERGDIKLTSFHGNQDTVVTFKGVDGIDKIILHDVTVAELRAGPSDLFTFGA